MFEDRTAASVGRPQERLDSGEKFGSDGEGGGLAELNAAGLEDVARDEALQSTLVSEARGRPERRNP